MTFRALLANGKVSGVVPVNNSSQQVDILPAGTEMNIPTKIPKAASWGKTGKKMGFTKRIFSLGLLMWLALGSCKKQELTADCGNGTAYVKEVTRAEGRVYSDSAQQRYILRVPNGFDSHDVGYVCNLPLEFQKEGLEVQFSGRYIE
jgi:hypothetical protein